MPEPTAILTVMLGAFLAGMSRKAADRYGDSILEFLEDSAKYTANAVDKGIARDYEAGGIFAQISNINWQNT